METDKIRNLDKFIEELVAESRSALPYNPHPFSKTLIELMKPLLSAPLNINFDHFAMTLKNENTNSSLKKKNIFGDDLTLLIIEKTRSFKENEKEETILLFKLISELSKIYLLPKTLKKLFNLYSQNSQEKHGSTQTNELLKCISSIVQFENSSLFCGPLKKSFSSIFENTAENGFFTLIFWFKSERIPFGETKICSFTNLETKTICNFFMALKQTNVGTKLAVRIEIFNREKVLQFKKSEFILGDLPGVLKCLKWIMIAITNTENCLKIFIGGSIINSLAPIGKMNGSLLFEFNAISEDFTVIEPFIIDPLEDKVLKDIYSQGPIKNLNSDHDSTILGNFGRCRCISQNKNFLNGFGGITFLIYHLSPLFCGTEFTSQKQIEIIFQILSHALIFDKMILKNTVERLRVDGMSELFLRPIPIHLRTFEVFLETIDFFLLISKLSDKVTLKEILKRVVDIRFWSKAKEEDQLEIISWFENFVLTKNHAILSEKRIPTLYKLVNWMELAHENLGFDAGCAIEEKLYGFSFSLCFSRGEKFLDEKGISKLISFVSSCKKEDKAIRMIKFFCMFYDNIRLKKQIEQFIEENPKVLFSFLPLIRNQRFTSIFLNFFSTFISNSKNGEEVKKCAIRLLIEHLKGKVMNDENYSLLFDLMLPPHKKSKSNTLTVQNTSILHFILKSAVSFNEKLKTKFCEDFKNIIKLEENITQVFSICKWAKYLLRLTSDKICYLKTGKKERQNALDNLIVLLVEKILKRENGILALYDLHAFIVENHISEKNNNSSYLKMLLVTSEVLLGIVETVKILKDAKNHETKPLDDSFLKTADFVLFLMGKIKEKYIQTKVGNFRNLEFNLVLEEVIKSSSSILSMMQFLKNKSKRNESLLLLYTLILELDLKNRKWLEFVCGLNFSRNFELFFFSFKNIKFQKFLIYFLCKMLLKNDEKIYIQSYKDYKILKNKIIKMALKINFLKSVELTTSIKPCDEEAIEKLWEVLRVDGLQKDAENFFTKNMERKSKEIEEKLLLRTEKLKLLKSIRKRFDSKFQQENAEIQTKKTEDGQKITDKHILLRVDYEMRGFLRRVELDGENPRKRLNDTENYLHVRSILSGKFDFREKKRKNERIKAPMIVPRKENQKISQKIVLSETGLKYFKKSIKKLSKLGKIQKKFDCQAKIFLNSAEGKFLICEKGIAFIGISAGFNISLFGKKRLVLVCFPDGSVGEVFSRSSLNKDETGFEVFGEKVGSAIFLFKCPKNAKTAMELVCSKNSIVLEVNAATAFHNSKLLKNWQEGEISNFEFLLKLNFYAGRSFNDPNQYPVFPWVLKTYSEETIDLYNPAVYRNLNCPVGALNEERREVVKKKFVESRRGSTPPFHYGTHYSSQDIVTYYNLRVEPFTSYFLRMNEGNLDHADRCFWSIETSWNLSYRQGADVKELIPEFFFFPELFKNCNSLCLGQRQNGALVEDVILPPWAQSPEEFVYIHRKALESPHVSKHLNKWIDLIFGYKQKGEEAVRALNVFFYLTYADRPIRDIKKKSLLRKTSESQKLDYSSFGAIPKQLLSTPCPKRKFSLFRRSKIINYLKNSFLHEKSGEINVMNSDSFHKTLMDLKVKSKISAYMFDIEFFTGSFSKNLFKSNAPRTYSKVTQTLFIGGYEDSSIKVFHFNGVAFEDSFSLCGHNFPVVALASNCKEREADGNKTITDLTIVSADISGSITVWKCKGRGLYKSFSKNRVRFGSLFSTPKALRISKENNVCLVVYKNRKICIVSLVSKELLSVINVNSSVKPVFLEKLSSLSLKNLSQKEKSFFKYQKKLGTRSKTAMGKNFLDGVKRNFDSDLILLTQNANNLQHLLSINKTIGMLFNGKRKVEQNVDLCPLVVKDEHIFVCQKEDQRECLIKMTFNGGIVQSVKTEFAVKGAKKCGKHPFFLVYGDSPYVLAYSYSKLKVEKTFSLFSAKSLKAVELTRVFRGYFKNPVFGKERSQLLKKLGFMNSFVVLGVVCDSEKRQIFVLLSNGFILRHLLYSKQNFKVF